MARWHHFLQSLADYLKFPEAHSLHYHRNKYTFNNNNKLITSCQRMLTKGRIAILSSLASRMDSSVLDRRLVHAFLGSHELIPQTASRSAQPFCVHRCKGSHCFSMGGVINPEKLPFPLRICTPSNTWFFGPTRVKHPKRHLDQFSRFSRAHEHSQQTDKPTDHATLCVANRPLSLANAAMRPNNHVSP